MRVNQMRLAVMAWRNLWRYGRRTLTTIAAMTLALLTLIVWTSFVQGFLRDLRTTIVEVEIGDLQVYPPDYRVQPSIFDRIGSSAELVDSLGAMGFDASARLLGGGLAAAGDASAGVSLRGVETGQDARVSVVYDRVAQGSWLDPSDPAGIVIGGRLARTLDVGVGDELVLLSQATDGSIANGLYRVRGILAPFSEATDRGGVFLVRQAFLDFFVLPGGAHQVVVRNAEGQPLEASAARIRAAAPDLDVLTWRELFPTLATMLDSVEGTMYILFMIVYLAIAILLVNATLMAVFERIKELGLLKAIGALADAGGRSDPLGGLLSGDAGRGGRPDPRRPAPLLLHPGGDRPGGPRRPDLDLGDRSRPGHAGRRKSDDHRGSAERHVRDRPALDALSRPQGGADPSRRGHAAPVSATDDVRMTATVTSTVSAP